MEQKGIYIKFLIYKAMTLVENASGVVSEGT